MLSESRARTWQCKFVGVIGVNLQCVPTGDSPHSPQSSNFLKWWVDAGTCPGPRNCTFPQGWTRKPVTYVALEDARAYAAWAGKRLPNECEWQYAAQGVDGRTFPWGDEFDPSLLPEFQVRRRQRTTKRVLQLSEL